MHRAARPMTVIARIVSTHTARKMWLWLLKPSPLSTCLKSTIWKKNGRSSVGAETSASKSFERRPGSTGAARRRSARRWRWWA